MPELQDVERGCCQMASGSGPLAVRPPSMGRMTPLMKPACPDSRKATVSATSAGLPTRPNGCRATPIVTFDATLVNGCASA